MASRTRTNDKAIDRLLRWVIRGGAVFLLVLPAIAMRFTTEVNWGPEDFVVMGVILLAAVGACELVLRMSTDWRYRIAFGLAIAIACMTVGANLAVGIVGDEDNPANLMYFGVVGMFIVGAVVVRGRAREMSWVLAAAGLAFAAASFIAVQRGLGPVPFFPVAVFTALWLASAWLFHSAALRAEPVAGPD